MWTALVIMVALWVVMRWAGSRYLNAVDAITERALQSKSDSSALERFRSELKAQHEPEVMMITSVTGILVILWLMMFKPF